MDAQEIQDVAASFQEAVADVIAAKVRKAVSETGACCVAAGGGVICNKRIRGRIREACGVKVLFPSPGLCIDNAAMTAGLGFHLLKAGTRHDLFLDVDPRPLRMKARGTGT
jgi:N6-L-threonylcarbamoyladenine synthase